MKRMPASPCRRSRPVCPRRGHHQGARIVWGLVHDEDTSERLERRLAEGSAVLGGCMVDDDRWQCPGCEHRWA